MFKYSLITLLVIFITACSTVPEAIKPIESPVTIVKGQTEIAATHNNPPLTTIGGFVKPHSMLVTSIATPNISIDINPIDLVILPRPPITDKEKAQYSLICETWKVSFPKGEDLVSVSNEITLVPFYWLVKSKISVDCATLIDDYDYTRAQYYTASKGLDPTKILLVCQIPKGLVTMNLTELQDPDDIRRALDIWHRKLGTLPNHSETIQPIDLLTSTKMVLGSLGSLINHK